MAKDEKPQDVTPDAEAEAAAPADSVEPTAKTPATSAEVPVATEAPAVADQAAKPAPAETPATSAEVPVATEAPAAADQAATPTPAEPAVADQAAAPAAAPAEPAKQPAKLNPVHIILPIVLMVVALAGILTPILYAHNPGKGGMSGYFVPGQGQGQGGGNRQTFGPGGNPSGRPTSKQSVMPSGMPTAMPTKVPTALPTGSGPYTCQGSQCPTTVQRGQGQRGPSWPRGNRSMSGLSGAEIAIVSASAVVFVGGAVYLIIALRRRSALRKRERE